MIPYRVEIHENGHRIPAGGFSNLEDAKAHALRRVDDALPHNTVHVIDAEGKDVGHAYLGRDGGSYWSDAS